MQSGDIRRELFSQQLSLSQQANDSGGFCLSGTEIVKQ
jgi:hypothetical protein